MDGSKVSQWLMTYSYQRYGEDSIRLHNRLWKGTIWEYVNHLNADRFDDGIYTFINAVEINPLTFDIWEMYGIGKMKGD